MLDGKIVTIWVLSVLILLTAVFGFVTYRDLQKRKKLNLDNFVTQERKYKDENTDSSLKKNNETYFRAENKHLYKFAKFHDSRIFRKALLYYETGQFKEALSLFTDLKVDSKNPETISAAYYYIASSLVNLKKEKRALVFLNRVVQNLKPNSFTTKAIILQGEINRKYQFSNESLEVYLHKLFIETPEGLQKNQILTQLGYLKLFRDELDGAMDHFKKANTELAKLGEARVFIRKNMYWKAISIYEDILKHKNFKNIQYFKDVKKAFLKQTYYYAKKWMKNRDYNHAYFYFRKIVDYFPNSMYGESSLFWIGEIFFNRKIYWTAIKYYNMALSNGNKNKDAASQFKKGLAYFYLRRFGDSVRNLQKITSYYKTSGYYNRALQWIRMCNREIIYKK